jgi:integrase
MRGQIRKRGKSWAVIVYLGRDPATGKERRKWYTYRTQREAEVHLAQLVVQVASGGCVPPSRLLTRDFLSRWLDDYAAGAVTGRTLENYRGMVRKHLVPTLGHIPLARLSAQAIQGHLSAKLRAETLSPTSIAYQFGILREALRHAVRWGLLVRNPTDFVEPPRRARREMHVLDEEQSRLFLAEARRTSPYYLLYLTAVLTGMRQGELLGLRWGDIDLALAEVSVQRNLSRIGPITTFREPKTERGRRVVALPPLLVETLRAARGTARDDHLVFCQADARPLHGHNITQRDLRAVCRRAGVLRIRFHDLRHCHATHLLRAGVHPKVVQERLGHSTPAVTLGIYSHVLRGMQEAAARSVEARLPGSADPDGSRRWQNGWCASRTPSGEP